MDIRFVKRDVLKEKPDQKHLGFGKYMTDYMFVMDWTKEDGWKDARIVPEGPISLEPACVTLHYAQETFEGMKAYRTAEGKIQLFRPEMNAKRMINSNARLCMPEFPVLTRPAGSSSSSTAPSIRRPPMRRCVLLPRTAGSSSPAFTA